MIFCHYITKLLGVSYHYETQCIVFKILGIVCELKYNYIFPYCHRLTFSITIRTMCVVAIFFLGLLKTKKVKIKNTSVFYICLLFIEVISFTKTKTYKIASVWLKELMHMHVNFIKIRIKLKITQIFWSA